MPDNELRFVNWAQELYVALFQIPVGETGEYEEALYSGIYWSPDSECPTCKRGIGYNFATCDAQVEKLPQMIKLAMQVEKEKGYTWRLVRCSKEAGWEELDKDEYLRNFHTFLHGDDPNGEVLL